MLLKLDAQDLPLIEIRRANDDDAEFFHYWWNNGALMKNVGFENGLGISFDDVVNAIHSTNLFVVLLEGQPIGEVNYKVNDLYEFGIKIIPEFQSKGLGIHILKLFFDYLYYIGAKDLMLDVLVDNVRARQLYEKLGFETIKEMKGGWIDAQGIPRDYLVMVKKYGT